MKVMNITNVDGFFGMLDQCEEKVELVTENGDKFNMKSKLSQFAALAKVFWGGMIKEVELITHCQADTNRIILYMMNNKI